MASETEEPEAEAPFIWGEYWNDYLDEMRELGLSSVADQKIARGHFSRGTLPKRAAELDARFCATGEY